MSNNIAMLSRRRSLLSSSVTETNKSTTVMQKRQSLAPQRRAPLATGAPLPSLQSLKRRASLIPLPPSSKMTPVSGKRCTRLQLKSFMSKTSEVEGSSGSKFGFTIQKRVVVDGSPAAHLRRPAQFMFPSKMRRMSISNTAETNKFPAQKRVSLAPRRRASLAESKITSRR